eukprot:TRINITY_DN3764_c0_g2_i1.p1 TRINITY_DN3764_c0_g2~~TRINITY_DN3764_c0_g2_i1.p1  ORF type:complete len:681 (-),score=210.53 TRINITY_DN3764_c0_g2_i1:123-2165(-)
MGTIKNMHSIKAVVCLAALLAVSFGLVCEYDKVSFGLKGVNFNRLSASVQLDNKFCPNLQKTESCCSAETVQKIEAEYNKLVQAIQKEANDTLAIQEQLYVKTSVNPAAVNTQKKEALTKLADRLTKLPQLEPIWSSIATTQEKRMEIATSFVRYRTLDEKAVENLQTQFKTKLAEVNKEREKCLSFALQYQRFDLCTRCEPNLTAKGFSTVNGRFTSRITPDASQTIKENCFGYVSGLRDLNAAITLQLLLNAQQVQANFLTLAADQKPEEDFMKARQEYQARQLNLVLGFSSLPQPCVDKTYCDGLNTWFTSANGVRFDRILRSAELEKNKLQIITDEVLDNQDYNTIIGAIEGLRNNFHNQSLYDFTEGILSSLQLQRESKYRLSFANCTAPKGGYVARNATPADIRARFLTILINKENATLMDAVNQTEVDKFQKERMDFIEAIKVFVNESRTELQNEFKNVNFSDIEHQHLNNKTRIEQFVKKLQQKGPPKQAEELLKRLGLGNSQTPGRQMVTAENVLHFFSSFFNDDIKARLAKGANRLTPCDLLPFAPLLDPKFNTSATGADLAKAVVDLDKTSINFITSVIAETPAYKRTRDPESTKKLYENLNQIITERFLQAALEAHVDSLARAFASQIQETGVPLRSQLLQEQKLQAKLMRLLQESTLAGRIRGSRMN